jgi:hypothetical protein
MTKRRRATLSRQDRFLDELTSSARAARDITISGGAMDDFESIPRIVRQGLAEVLAHPTFSTQPVHSTSQR